MTVKKTVFILLRSSTVKGHTLLKQTSSNYKIYLERFALGELEYLTVV